MNVQTLASSAPYCSTIPPISAQRSIALRYGPLSCRPRWLGIPLFACRKAGACMRSSHRSSAYPGPFIACKAPSIGEDRFEEEVLKSDLPVLVDFWAEWCGPCKLVAPLMDWINQEYKDTLKVYKIDTDANPSLVERYKVYGLPTLILFKNGNEVPGSRREGAINKKKLKALLDHLLASAATT